MRFSQLVDEDACERMFHTVLGEKDCPHVAIYKQVRGAIADTKNSRNYDALWAKIAPTGNIYRYIGFRVERLRHCEDLTKQLRELADHENVAKVLGGSTEDRQTKLFELLEKIQQQNVPELEDGESSGGFPPLEEFLSSSTKRIGPLLVPTDPEDWLQWRKNHLMASLIFLVQVMAPPLIISNKWYSSQNLLRDPQALWDRLSFAEVMCIGQSTTAQLTTVLGTVMLMVINTIILNYSEGEAESAAKLQRMPLDRLWGTCGIFANGLCCLMISIAIPLEFWAEEGPTGIIMNAMALLFVFSFDDLTSDAFGYLGKDDASFERTLSWNYALLSHCPVKLSDLVNPAAEKPEEIWQIAYDTAGHLQKAAGAEGGPGRCATRLSPVLARGTEATPLVTNDTSEDGPLPVVNYCTGPGQPARVLPGPFNVAWLIWGVVGCLLHVIWWVFPVIWFIVNKPCFDEAGHSDPR